MDAKKDYSHVISGYRNELRLNGKATLSAYCRSVGVSISAVHHWMENYGITTKKIKAEVAELAGCDSPFVPLSSEMPVPVRSSSRIELTFPNGVLLSADQHPLSGSAFVFFSKNRQSVKILRWDGDGFLLYHKRLERGTFETPRFDAASGAYRLPWKTFSLIMEGISCVSGTCPLAHCSSLRRVY